MPPAKKAAPVKKAAAKKAAPKPKTASERALTDFEEKFAKSFGAKTLTRSDKIISYQVISTGSIALDLALGVGGWVEGRLHEIWGPEGIGKTTMAMMAIAEAQRKYPGKMTAYVSVEHKFDKPWAIAHGVDLTWMYLYEPDTAEDVADAVKDLVRSGVVSLVVVDSIGAMIPEAEKEKDADKAVMAQQAKIVTRMVKIAASECPKTNATVLMINQVRANLAYGGSTTTGGGFALKHSTTTKVKCKRTSTDAFKAKVGNEDVIVGHEIAFYIERNGCAPAYRTALVSLFNQATLKWGPLGIDRADEAATIGLRYGSITQKAGGFYTMPDGEIVRGRDKVVEALRLAPEMVVKIREQALATKVDAVFEEEIDPDTLVEEIDVEVTPSEPAADTIEGETKAKVLDFARGEG